MAPFPINTPELGLHESEISQPPPLRIIKRSKTTSGSSASGESLCGRRSSSSSSLYSKGSPPLATHGPLTVHKLRKGRPSILGSSIDSSRDLGYRASVFETLKRSSDLHDDKDLTPKGNPISRVTSAGAFLKAEYHDRKEHSDDGYYSIKANRHTINLPSYGFLNQPNNAPSSNNNNPPKIPERRLSKSRNFLLRAIGGQNGEVPPPIRRSSSTMSRNTLVRRISRRRDPSVGSYCSSHDGSTLSSDTRCSFKRASLDRCDTMITANIPSQQSSSLESMLNTPIQDMFVLYPHIMVTPEVSSIDGGLSVLWVAIQITGVLQVAEGNPHRSPEVEQFPIDSTNPQPSNLSCYGKLHSMRIDLHPGQGSTILEIIGNLHESKTIRAGETQLVLAKIRLSKIRLPSDGSEDSTEGIIANLQNHLGETISSYLTVRLTYKHSAFPNHKPLHPQDGMKQRVSRIETEATATIKRRNPESAWSPRTSQTMSNSLESGPIVQLVVTHFSPGKAEEVKRRLIHDRISISTGRKFGYWTEDSDDNMMEQGDPSDRLGFKIDSAITSSLHTSRSRRSLRKSMMSRPSGISSPQSVDDESSQAQLDDMDPARKIWSEMRLTSRGGRYRNGRASISANHYFMLEEDKTPTRAISEDNQISKASHANPIPCPASSADVGAERSRIMEIALRNKRSVGAETLRSIAPSIGGIRGDGKSKGGPTISLGLGVGRAWGWSPPWW